MYYITWFYLDGSIYVEERTEQDLPIGVWSSPFQGEAKKLAIDFCSTTTGASLILHRGMPVKVSVREASAS